MEVGPVTVSPGAVLRWTAPAGPWTEPDLHLFPQDGHDFESLLKHADTAMYLAKESGRNAYQFFASEMNVPL